MASLADGIELTKEANKNSEKPIIGISFYNFFFVILYKRFATFRFR